MQNDINAVRSLLQQKADVNAAQSDGMTALHWAAHKDNLEIARMLVQAGADVKRGTRLGSILPLFMACTNGSAPMIELLLKAGADANSTNELGTTALMQAAASGSVEAVTTLVNYGANVNAKEKARQQTALMFAAARNRAPIIRVLAAGGADLDAVSKITAISNDLVDEDGNPIPAPSRTGETRRRPRGEGKVAGIGGMTALHYAARDGFMETVRALVESGASVNRINPMDKSTPLVVATINGQYDIAKYFLDHGANPNLGASDGLTPLYAVLDSRWAPVAWTPTASTADSGIVQQKVSHLELMKALLERGANPNAKLLQTPWYNPPHHAQRWVQWAGTTPFWRAANATDVAAMKLLVSYGADGKTPSDENTTPLMAAAGVGWTGNFSVNAPDSFLAAAKYLVEEIGIDVNAQHTSGYTAIMGAAWRGDNELVQYLADKGAKLDVRTELGWSVTDMANGPSLRSSVPLKHPETISLVLKLGAPPLIQVDDEEILGIIKRKIEVPTKPKPKQ
ncbi:MAG: ankyrin repeat domain-containing protein [Acidobacteria bacterium]|nr:ankyrin repeat domain-containing protein [Acidobacteriota bacterium]